jgi:hypothetical protein
MMIIQMGPGVPGLVVEELGVAALALGTEVKVAFW